MKKKTLNESMEDISKKIKKIFDSVDEEEHSALAEYIAVEATINAAYNIYEGIGILDIVKRRYEECCENALDDEDNSHLKIVNLN